jgi:hypothetical protein
MLNESELGKEDHPPDVKRKLIRLAYFKRFPKLVKSNLTKFLQLVDSTLTDEAVCAALDMPVKATDTQDDTQVLAEKTKGIKWDVGIVQTGYEASYKRSDIIIDPILRNLRNWATSSSPLQFKAPYTKCLRWGKTKCIVASQLSDPGRDGSFFFQSTRKIGEITARKRKQL